MGGDGAPLGPRLSETVVSGIAGLRSLAGCELGPSQWITIDQDRIDGFAQWTDDRQWIHTDPERAARGPFGTTIAHGFLTLSLIVRFWQETVRVDGVSMGINYGLDRVRFPAPVPSGSRVRARFRVDEVEDVPGGAQARITATVERDGGEKPVCVAVLLLRYMA